MSVRTLRVPLLCTLALAASACGPAAPKFPDRTPGARTPLSADCDPIDPTRCALPWPSNALTVADPSKPTGLRLALNFRSLPSAGEVDYLDLADGFSRLSPVLTGFKGKLAPESLGDGTSGALRLFSAQPGAADEGKAIPMHLELRPSTSPRNGDESLVIGYPLVPLAPASDYVAVVLDGLKGADGTVLSADHLTRVALGLDEPSGDDEARRAAYDAPVRALLEKAGIAPEHVVRVWDFTTRSKDDAKKRLQSMRVQEEKAIDQGGIDVVLDTVTVPPAGGAIAAIVEGRLTGLPDFRTAEGMLSLDEQEVPLAVGQHDAPFRVMIPSGSGNYRVVLYGHGTGGTYSDDAFDDRVAAAGLAKVSGLFYGWDGNHVADTLLGMGKMEHGVAKSTAGLMQGLADFSALEHALDGVLGDALAAPKLKDVDNPAAGRRPDAAEPIWTGGSLGGTLGLVYSGLSPRVRFAVLNVPGAGWTHFVPGSDLFTLIQESLQANYGSPLDFWMSLMVSQLAWDDVDGGNWADDLAQDGSVYLLQESMGDPVLPNPGSELAAEAVHAVQVAAVLSPIPGLKTADSTQDQSAITQFRVPDSQTGLSRHGFAARSGPAGDAAREQISTFLESALQGHPRIEIPSLCQSNTVPGSCDFSP